MGEDGGAEARRRLLRWGFGCMALWGAAGLGLEALHAFKWPGLLEPSAEVRRLLWRLAHAHGALLGLLAIALGLASPHLAVSGGARAGRWLRAATLLLPGGFFLGGLWTHGGDPGLGVLLAPVGALALIGAMVAAARAA